MTLISNKSEVTALLALDAYLVTTTILFVFSLLFFFSARCYQSYIGYQDNHAIQEFTQGICRLCFGECESVYNQLNHAC